MIWLRVRNTNLISLVLGLTLDLGIALAQTPTSITPPTPEPPNSRDPLQFARWEAELAESGHRLNPSPSTRARAVLAYEKLIGPICMPALQKSLIYPGKPTDPDCLKLIERTLELDPSSPAAICARDGIDASSCRLAYAGQSIKAYEAGKNPGSQSESDIDLETVLASTKDKQAIRQWENEIYNIKRSANNLKDPRYEAALNKTKDLYRQIISQACRISRLRMTEVTPPATDSARAPKTIESLSDETITQDPQSTPTQPMQEVLELLRRDNEKTPSSEKSKHSPDSSSKRIRYVSPECLKHIHQALELDPDFTGAICHKHGAYSPQCIQAKRKDHLASKRKNASSTGTPNPNTPPNQKPNQFETF